MIRYFLVAAVSLTLVSSKTLNNCPSPPSPSRLYEKQANDNVVVTFIPLSSKLGVTNEKEKYCTCSELTVNNQPIEPIRVNLEGLYVQQPVQVDMSQETKKNRIELEPATYQSGKNSESVLTPTSFVNPDESKIPIIDGEVGAPPVELATLPHQNQPPVLMNHWDGPDEPIGVPLASLDVSTVPEQTKDLTSSKPSKINESKETIIVGEVGIPPAGLTTLPHKNQPIDGPESKKKIESGKPIGVPVVASRITDEQAKDLSNLELSGKDESTQTIDLTSSVPSVGPNLSSKEDNNDIQVTETGDKNKLAEPLDIQLESQPPNSEPSQKNESIDALSAKVSAPSPELSISHKQEDNGVQVTETGDKNKLVEPLDIQLELQPPNSEPSQKNESIEPLSVKLSAPSAELSISHKQENDGVLVTETGDKNKLVEPLDAHLASQPPSAVFVVSNAINESGANSEPSQKNELKESIDVKVPSAELDISHKEENNGVQVTETGDKNELGEPLNIQLPSAALDITNKIHESDVNSKTSQENESNEPNDLTLLVPQEENGVRNEISGKNQLMTPLATLSAVLNIPENQEQLIDDSKQREEKKLKEAVAAGSSLHLKQDNNLKLESLKSTSIKSKPRACASCRVPGL